MCQVMIKNIHTGVTKPIDKKFIKDFVGTGEWEVQKKSKPSESKNAPAKP